ncbi:hypothetical protein [Emticicia sp. BO119]|uniref:hypothetical protein n=1 Tax=Emticicia sp. BO119 TaxID=2757768 RepID=UPI0015F0E0C9|nr:hypothetical protein [Emticicia sp. BO119]MBA4852028.1 hypothetical protein [Emticicia sp. BO119]
MTEPRSGIISDKLIEFEIKEMPTCSRLIYKVKNLTDKSLFINWNRASVIIDGEAFRVYDGEMRGIDSNKEQLSMHIPANAFINSVLVSGRNLEYISRIGSWTSTCFFEGKKSIGKNIIIHFPLVYNNQTIDYHFKYEITGIQKKRENILLH